MRLAIIFALVVSTLPSIGNAQSNAIELPKLVEAFMIQPSSSPEWSMGAHQSTPQIIWSSSGVESRPQCGSFTSCRRGRTRVLLNGKEMQHLRQRLEPVPWDLFMASKSPDRFGPEQITISPLCDTVQCAFDFRKAMTVRGFTLRQVCKAGPAPFQQAAYLVTKGAKRTYAVMTDSSGSGGVSTSLTLFFNPPSDTTDLCADAKNAE